MRSFLIDLKDSLRIFQGCFTVQLSRLSFVASVRHNSFRISYVFLFVNNFLKVFEKSYFIPLLQPPHVRCENYIIKDHTQCQGIFTTFFLIFCLLLQENRCWGKPIIYHNIYCSISSIIKRMYFVSKSIFRITS